MSDRLSSIAGWAGQESLDSQGHSPEMDLRHVRRVTSSLLREALETWAELWEEFQDRVISGAMALPEAQKGFRPRCGWPEFLEKMWQLKFYLDSTKRFCEQRP